MRLAAAYMAGFVTAMVVAQLRGLNARPWKPKTTT